jgi:hypothetical protein
MMKKVLMGVMVLLMCMGTLLFGGCGSKYASVSLSANSSSVELTLGNSETESKEVVVSINNYVSSISSVINFSVDNNIVKFDEQVTADGRTSVSVVAIRGGTATITARMLDGGKTVLIPVTVVEPLSTFH